jgi:heptosyltransferase-2
MTQEVRIDPSGMRRVLVRATNWVGDVVMTLPALEALRENCPEAAIHVLARPWVTGLLDGHPAVNRVIVLEQGQGPLGRLRSIRSAVSEIRGHEFDLAVLFQNAFEAALIAYLGRCRRRLGYDTDGRGFLLSHPVARTPEVRGTHQVEYYLHLLRSIGWKAESRDPRLVVNPDREARARRLLQSSGIGREDFLLGLGPGAIYGPAKRWPTERFAEVADWAVERWGAKVLVLGSSKESGICSDLTRAMRHEALNVCGGTPLGEAVALLSVCRLFVTNDSGLMHVGAALGVPTLAVFGSTDPTATGPRGPRSRVLRHEVTCGPCLKRECETDFRCMLSIQPEEVWEEMVRMREVFA